MMVMRMKRKIKAVRGKNSRKHTLDCWIKKNTLEKNALDYWVKV